MRLDHEVIGKQALEKLRHWLGSMKRMQAAHPMPGKARLLANKASSGRVVNFQGQTFAQMIEVAGWILIPPQSRHMETLVAHTLNCHWNFPAMQYRTFVDFAYTFGFRSADDRDPCGKSIIHFFFCALQYCWLAADIAKYAFLPGERKLHGDYEAAMSQRVELGQPDGFSALHVLCNASGTGMMAARVIEDLIDNKIVPLDAFKDWRNNDVSVFVYPEFGLCQIVVRI